MPRPSHAGSDPGAEAALNYVVETLQAIRPAIPQRAGNLLLQLLDLMCLEASEVSAELASARTRIVLLDDRPALSDERLAAKPLRRRVMDHP